MKAAGTEAFRRLFCAFQGVMGAIPINEWNYDDFAAMVLRVTDISSSQVAGLADSVP